MHDLEFDEKVEYTIVGSTEVDLAENKISNESPLGEALLEQKSQTVEVNAPAGIMKYKILSITKNLYKKVLIFCEKYTIIVMSKNKAFLLSLLAHTKL